MSIWFQAWQQNGLPGVAACFYGWRKIRLPLGAARFHVWRKIRLPEIAARFHRWGSSAIAAVAFWRRIDPRFRNRQLRALAAGLGLGILLAFVSAHTQQDYTTVALAKPVLPSIPWSERVAAFGNRIGQAFDLESAKAREFAGWILEAADRQRLEPELIASLVQVESGFRKHARSYAGAVGPAQVKPRYWSEFCGGDDLTEPRFNINCGAQVLAHLKELCGGGECALVAYNIGRNGTRIQAGRRFVSKVDYHFQQIKTL